MAGDGEGTWLGRLMERASSLAGVSAIAVTTGLGIGVENSPAVMAAVVVVVGAEEKATAMFEISGAGGTATFEQDD